MLNLKRNLQINLYLMVLLSSILLGWGMESTTNTVTALLGVTLGFLVTDCLKLYRLRGVIANIVSFAILFVAMGDFFSVDGTGKLKSVAALLTYLIIILMFQEKTPRLIWQLLALSLLQVVLSAIFSLDFEAGLLFFSYFLVVGAALFQQSLYIQQSEIEKQNLRSARLATRLIGATDQPAGSSAEPKKSLLPIVFHDTRDQHSFHWRSLLWQIGVWGFLSFAFTMTMFQVTPRHSAPWYGPAAITATTTAGVSKSVDLDERGKIEQSQKTMMRAQFIDRQGRGIQMSSAPYFRGLALSSLVIRNGKTNFEAPYDRVDRLYYQPLSYWPETDRSILQCFTVEESSDPLVYGVFPFYRVPPFQRHEATPNEVNFCHEISALTRCELRAPMKIQPYKYSAATVLDEGSRLARSWPYFSNTADYREWPMSYDKPQHAWLTRMDAGRYARLVEVSDEIDSRVKAAGGGRRDFLLAVENYFLTPGRFKYSLDYTKTPRDDTLDPIEDFFRNHRSGHCEIFAAATTLMLRHQGIPARLVVGYCGGDFDQVTDTYFVRASHAHAWVEAYLRPEDCTDTMFAKGQAGTGGAWQIVESTPATTRQVVKDVEAIDLARNAWDDFVIGRDTNATSGTTQSPVVGWLAGVNLRWWGKQIENVENSFRRPAFKYGIPVGLAVVAFLFMVNSYLRGLGDSQRSQAGLLRRLVAKAVALVSPELARWVAGTRRSEAIEFYQAMEKLLASHDLHRAPNQSHREFAVEVSQSFSDHPQFDVVDRSVAKLTRWFNRIRFGSIGIDDQTAVEIDQTLTELKAALSG